MNPKLKWKCRRGMKELDLLMEGYLANGYPSASAAHQEAFEKLLDYQDPLILDLLFGKVQDDDVDIQSLIELLKDYQVKRVAHE